MLGAVAGIVGVLVVLGGASGAIDPRGVAASAAALTLSCAGCGAGQALERRHRAALDDGLAAGPRRLGPRRRRAAGRGRAAARWTPPRPRASCSRSLVATALAYLCWFGGLQRLSAATVGVVGLLNPVTGVLLGALVAHESFTLAQVGGIALVLAGILAASWSRAPRPVVELLPSAGQEAPVLAGAR